MTPDSATQFRAEHIGLSAWEAASAGQPSSSPGETSNKLGNLVSAAADSTVHSTLPFANAEVTKVSPPGSFGLERLIEELKRGAKGMKFLSLYQVFLGLTMVSRNT